MAYVITTFSNAKRVSYEAVAVTGSTTDHDTGLQTIENVQATVKDANQGAGDAGYITVNFDGTDGLLDIYAWDDAGVAASVAATVLVLVIGT